MFEDNGKLDVDENAKDEYDKRAEVRFWKKVEKTDDCWIWTAATQGDYGEFGYRGKVVTAHTHSYEMATGEKLEHGEWVLHTCDNPLCVNPAHLRKDTPRKNSHDMVEKGRSSYGDKHGLAKLTNQEAIEIRAKYKNNEATGTELAKLYHISQGQVSRIVNCKVWNNPRIWSENAPHKITIGE